MATIARGEACNANAKTDDGQKLELRELAAWFGQRCFVTCPYHGDGYEKVIPPKVQYRTASRVNSQCIKQKRKYKEGCLHPEDEGNPRLIAKGWSEIPEIEAGHCRNQVQINGFLKPR
jgi:hypothetical protein